MRDYLWPCIFYLLVWVTACLYWVLVAQQSHALPLTALGVLAIGIPLITRLVLAGSQPLPATAEHSWLEPFALYFCLAAVFAFEVHGIGLVTLYTEQYLGGMPLAVMGATVLARILIYVLVPIVILSWLIGHPLASFGWHRPFWRMLGFQPLVLVPVLAVLFGAYYCTFDEASSFIKSGEIARGDLFVGMPLVFGWLVLSIGIVQGFLFYGVLQSRLAVVLRSDWAGLVIVALVMALLPVLVASQVSPDQDHLTAVLNAILITSPAHFAIGYVWLRTRNLLVIALALGGINLLPEYLASIAKF